MNLIIIGAGEYGKTVLDIAQQSGEFQSISFLDDNSEDAIGKCEDYLKYTSEDTYMYPAFGDNKFRLEWIEKLEDKGIKVPTIIHESSYVSPKAHIASGVIILPKAIVNNDVIIEKGSIINCGAIIDHNNYVAKGSHIGLGAIIKRDNIIPAYTKIEAGDIVLEEKYKK